MDLYYRLSNLLCCHHCTQEGGGLGHHGGFGMGQFQEGKFFTWPVYYLLAKCGLDTKL